MKPQDKLSRYGRYAYSKPQWCRWMVIMDLAVRHYPRNLRQWASDNIMLKMVEMEYGNAN